MHRGRWIAVAVLTVVAAGVGYARALPLEPHLEVIVRRVRRTSSYTLYDLHMKSRGGEVFDDVHVEVLRGPVGVVRPYGVKGLAPGSTFSVKLTVTGGDNVPPAVRVVQEGRVSRTYDVDLEAWRER